MLVVCEGDGRARGLAHGEQLRDQIAEALERLAESTARRTGGPASDHIAAFLGATDFLPAIARHAPDLLDEMRGIAEGANADGDAILAHNLMDEEWWFSERRESRAACSLLAVAARDGRPALAAQTMDLPSSMDGGQVLLRIRPEAGPDALVLSAAGMIGLCGANAAGLGVCVNALSMLRHSPTGLPVAFVTRSLLAQPTLAAAEAVLTSIPHASGQHYALTQGDAVAGYECSAGGAVPVGGDDRLWHTNHPLATEDIDEELADDGPAHANSVARQRLLDREAPEAESLDDCRRILEDRSAPICAHATPEVPWLTFGSVAFELGDPPRAAVALGPADETPWQELAV